MFDLKLIQNPLATGAGAVAQVYDVVIIGGGPAGLTAAIYLARDGRKALVLDRETTGGLAATTEHIENYPGFPEGISGADLMVRFRQQAERFGADLVEFEEVKALRPLRAGLFEVQTEAGAHQGKAVIIATGSEPKKLNLPGEQEFYGRGLSYCATCDGPLFKGKDVVIIGAGNSGLQEGLQVLDYARSVTFVEFLPTSRAEQILQDRVRANPKSKLMFNYQVTAIQGGPTVTGVVVQERTSGATQVIPADGVFIYVGYAPSSQFVADLVERNRWGYIVTDERMRTAVTGLYAVGDVRADNPAQLAVAVSDGVKAALDIREYLQHLA